MFPGAELVGWDEDFARHRSVPLFRVKAGRRVISMEESKAILDGTLFLHRPGSIGEVNQLRQESQWRPDEVARFNRGAAPIMRRLSRGLADG